MAVYPSREYFIQEYVVNNKTRKQLAEENNVSVATIKTHLLEKRVLKPPLIQKETLIQKYVKEQKTIKEIAKELHVDRNAVSRAMNKYNIQIENHYDQYDDSLDDEWIDLYINKELSSVDIALKYGVAYHTVQTHLRRNGVQLRSLSDSIRKSAGKDVLHSDLSDHDKMYDLYVVQKKTLKELGEVYDCAPHVVLRCLKELNIPIRSQSEVKIGLLTGSYHPNWKGGITSLYMRLREFFATNIAQKARERDGFKCQICGSKKKLHVHHIVSFSEIVGQIISEHPEFTVERNANELYNIIVNDKRFLDIDNLITCCHDCHLYTIHNYHRTTSSQDSDKE